MADFLFIAPRCSGKTTELIKKSAETGIYIMVLNEQRRQYVLDLSIKLGYNIPNPVTVDDYFRCKFNGSWIRRDGIYIDEAEDVLKRIFSGIPIRGMTLTTQDPIYECKEDN